MEQEQPHHHPFPDPSTWIDTALPRLWRFLRRLGCDATAAEDLAQDAALAAISSGVYRLEQDAAMAWLHATARNLFRAHLRTKARQPQLTAEADAWPDASEFDAESEQLRSALRRCLMQLAPRARRAIELRYRQGAGREQIATELGVQASGIKSLLQRTRQQLRTCVENQRNES